MSRSPRTGGGLAVELTGRSDKSLFRGDTCFCSLSGVFLFNANVKDGELTDDTTPLEFGEEAGEVAKAGEDMGP